MYCWLQEIFRAWLAQVHTKHFSLFVALAIAWAIIRRRCFTALRKGRSLRQSQVPTDVAYEVIITVTNDEKNIITIFGYSV